MPQRSKDVGTVILFVVVVAAAVVVAAYVVATYGTWLGGFVAAAVVGAIGAVVGLVGLFCALYLAEGRRDGER